MDEEAIIQERKALWESIQAGSPEVVRKVVAEGVKEVDRKGRIVTAVVSREEEDRDHDIIRVGGGDWKGYMKNPVVLWGHDMHGLPVARCRKLWVEGKDLLAQDEFHSLDFARDVYSLYQDGFLNAFSIGFLPREAEQRGKDPEDWSAGFEYKTWEKVEHSCVTVPSNRSALIQRAESGDRAAAWMMRYYPVSKGVIPFKSYGLADEGAAWDGPGEVSKADVNDLKAMCTWYDAENPDVKSSYKLPHHLAEGYTTVWRGVAAAMARLQQAATQIPEADKAGCYNHLERHYEEFDKEPPGEMEEEEDGLDWGRFKCGEKEIYEEDRLAEDLHRLRGIALSVESIARGILKRDPTASGRHLTRIEEAHTAVEATLGLYRPVPVARQERATPDLTEKALQEISRMAFDFRKSNDRTEKVLEEIEQTKSALMRAFIGRGR